MKNRIFIISALAILLLTALIRFVWLERWEKPSACDCATVFSADSALAVPAARAMVGNGYYEYTLRMARIHCLQAFARELPASAWQDTLSGQGDRSRAFFRSLCP